MDRLLDRLIEQDRGCFIFSKGDKAVVISWLDVKGATA